MNVDDLARKHLAATPSPTAEQRATARARLLAAMDDPDGTPEPAPRGGIALTAVGIVAAAAALVVLMPRGTPARQVGEKTPKPGSGGVVHSGPVAAMRVTGGTAHQRTLVARAAHLMGEDGGIREVRIHRNTITITSRPRPTSRQTWLAQVMGQELRVLDSTLREVTVNGTPVRTAARVDLATLRQKVHTAAARSALTVTGTHVYPVGVGAVSVTARMSVRQILEDRPLPYAQLRAIVPTGVNGLITVAPNRTVVGRLGGGPGGRVDDAGDPAPASPPIPTDLGGPTRLTVDLSEGQPGTTQRKILDCAGGSSTVTDPQAVCAALDRNWLRYLPPNLAARLCLGLAQPLEVTITGTFHGTPVERSSMSCPASPSEPDWAALLATTSTTASPARADGVAPAATAAAAALPVVGGPDRLARAVRAAVAAIGAPQMLVGVQVSARQVELRAPRGAASAVDFLWRMTVLRDEIHRRASRTGFSRINVLLFVGAKQEQLSPDWSDNLLTPHALVRLARTRLAGSHIDVRGVTALPVRVGAVRLDAVETAQQVLADDGPDRINLATVVPHTVSVDVRLRMADGTSLGEFGRASSLFFDRSAAPPDVSPALPDTLTGPTRLTVRIGAATAVIDCGSGQSTVTNPVAACADLDTHWLTYFAPQDGIACAMPGSLVTAK
ncbi:MAG: hypothetical protein U0Y82_08900, partial [Thermoleophilia bacterium]